MICRTMFSGSTLAFSTKSVISRLVKYHFDTIVRVRWKHQQVKISEVDLSKIPLEKIRNFSIIAHIDHGKSTLADRMLEFVGAINPTTKADERVLDKLKVEKERGITVKAQTASFIYVE